MSYVRPVTPDLAELLRRQDQVISSTQLESQGFHSAAVYRRVRSGQWQRLLPTVLLARSGRPTRRQLLVAAWLWGGGNSAIDGPDACVWHQAMAPLPLSAPVHVVTPATGTSRSRGFVLVRRSIADITVAGAGVVPYVDAATALIVAARAAVSSDAAIDVLSRGLQLGAATVTHLLEARERIGDKWCRGVDSALRAVGVGLRSPLENDYRGLISTSQILPEPLWNQWLDLDDGLPPVCADALWTHAGMAQDINGRRYHGWGQQLEDTEARRSRMVAAGIVVQAATATQIRRGGPVLLDRLERTYLAERGRGLPPRVRLIDAPSWAREGRHVA